MGLSWSLWPMAGLGKCFPLSESSTNVLAEFPASLLRRYIVDQQDQSEEGPIKPTQMQTLLHWSIKKPFTEGPEKERKHLEKHGLLCIALTGAQNGLHMSDFSSKHQEWKCPVLNRRWNTTSPMQAPWWEALGLYWTAQLSESSA